MKVGRSCWTGCGDGRALSRGQAADSGGTGAAFERTSTGRFAQSKEEEARLSAGNGVCKWFNMRMGFGFLSLSSSDGVPLEPPLDVFVHQVRLC
ncbi:hypothetical protein Q5P01_017968 [Channa striata]|uniref:CSD domain-containing protein n=1 Tax=Channa striata TaxID=64152 RepID=A0AA88M6C7_CHASR|nr:hypothetical protein Q5P01_017968 [Channa striata]